MIYPQIDDRYDITIQEQIDMDALNWIIGNFKTTYGRPDSCKTDTSFINQLKKYYKAHDENGMMDIRYNPSPKGSKDGRLYSLKQLSLQSLPKKIRNTISRKFYLDLDIKNAHPTILSWYCKMNDIPCNSIECYRRNRDQCLNVVMTEFSLTKNEAKDFILAVMNGGKKIERNDITNPWLSTFMNEMDTILKKVVKLNPNLYKESVKCKTDKYNFEGSTLNKVLCSYENLILLWSLHYCRQNEIGVGALIFDGMLVRKDDIKDEEEFLNDLNEYLYEKTNITGVEFVVKPMDEVVELPVQKTSWEELGILDFPCIRTNGKFNYYFTDFLKEVRELNKKKILMNEYLTIIIPKFQQIICYIIDQQQYLCRSSVLEPNQFVKLLPKFQIQFVDEIELKLRTLNETKFLDLVQDKIPTYESRVYYPNLNDGKYPNCINVWTGFECNTNTEEIETKDDKWGPIRKILYHIKEVWCSGNQEHYDWFIYCWFRPLFLQPWIKTGKIPVLYGKQGTGKTILIDNFLIPYVFGKYQADAICGLEKLTQRFNSVVMDKIFISINELPSLDRGKITAFEILKNLTTEIRIMTEIKNGRIFSYDNFIRFIISTNNELSLYLEDGDRRFFPLIVSDKHMNDFNYMGEMAETFNLKNGKLFFDYCCEYEPITQGLHPLKAPMTNLKKSMIRASSPPPIKFLYTLQEYVDKYRNIDFENYLDLDEKGNLDDGFGIPQHIHNGLTDVGVPDYIHQFLYVMDTEHDWICVGLNGVYNIYKIFCVEEHETVSSFLSFAHDISGKITKGKRVSSGMTYDLTKINL